MRDLALAYCGLDCERCSVFVATVKDDDALRRATAERWSKAYGEFLLERLGRRELEPREVNCLGCRSTSRFVGCSICGIRACAGQRGLGSCAGCAEYPTCTLLNGFYSVHPEAKAALDEIRAGSRPSS